MQVQNRKQSHPEAPQGISPMFHGRTFSADALGKWVADFLLLGKLWLNSGIASWVSTVLIMQFDRNIQEMVANSHCSL